MGGQEYYHRHLPHYQPSDETFSVMFRLKGSLPREVVEQLRIDRENLRRLISVVGGAKREWEQGRRFHGGYFERFDKLLDGSSTGPKWLRKPRVAGILKEAIHYRDGRVFDLLCYCIMPNHVHLVFSTDGFSVRRAGCPTYTVTDILQKLKWNTALKANKVLGALALFGKMRAMITSFEMKTS